MNSFFLNSKLKSPKYLILFENGRLGNQLSQYIAISSLFPHAEVITIGFGSLHDCLAEHASLSSKPLTALIRSFFKKLGRTKTIKLAKLNRVWSLIFEERVKGQSIASFIPGLFAFIAIVDGFFQDDKYFSSFSSSKHPLRQDYLRDANEWIHSNIVSKGRIPYFLHIRRGDYIRWPSCKYPAVLPIKWYKEQLEEISQLDVHAHFVLCTDDIPYAEEWFGSDLRVSIYKGTEIQDFYVMTQCTGGGVLSASSFSWWAAWYGRQNSYRFIYLAPRYWAGWRQRKWYPSTIETPWLNYRNVYYS